MDDRRILDDFECGGGGKGDRAAELGMGPVLLMVFLMEEALPESVAGALPSSLDKRDDMLTISKKDC